MAFVAISKLLAQAGAASRRGAVQLVKAGRVTAAGQKVTKPGQRFDADSTKISVDNREIKKPPKIYFLLNKPVGVVSTVSDEKGRKTAVQFIKTSARIFPVGRLDINTAGLLILTNDGDLALRLTHPRFQVEKEYEASVSAPKNWSRGFLQKNLDKFKAGVIIGGGFKTSPAQAQVIKKSGFENRFLTTIVVHEGKKHEVRQMLAAIGVSVLNLRRTRIGNLRLAGLREGDYRQLDRQDIAKLSN